MSAIKLSSTEYFTKAEDAVKAELKDTNVMALPQIEKVVINTGVGKFEKSAKDEIKNYLEKLTGQVIKENYARKSEAGFKLRKGDLNALMVTLRGQKMKDLVFSMIYLALPRTKDFKGISADAWDTNMSTFSVGIPNAAIFPQIGFGSKINFGLQVSVVFKQPGENNKLLLEKLQFPFKK